MTETNTGGRNTRRERATLPTLRSAGPVGAAAFGLVAPALGDDARFLLFLGSLLARRPWRLIALSLVLRTAGCRIRCSRHFLHTARGSPSKGTRSLGRAAPSGCRVEVGDDGAAS